MSNNAVVHVAVALIVQGSQVLISLRPGHVHQGGLWEFPGGKLEGGESAKQALQREIKEELGIEIRSASPLMKIHHDYGDKKVLLDIWRVSEFSGEPRGAEGQALKWQPIDELDVMAFPAANRGIVHALQCSDRYLISGGFATHQEFLEKLQGSLSASVKVVQLRNKSMGADDFAHITKLAAPVCQHFKTPLLINTSVEAFQALSDYAQGLHLSSGRLFEFRQRPIAMDKILSASCHNEDELAQAKKIQADIVLISPVKETASHPGVPGIGWHRFSQLAALFNGPVYALGGMKQADLEDAKSAGAQGIAAISEFWNP